MSEIISEVRVDSATQTLSPSVKVPPHAIEAEQAVLGGLMLNDEAWFNVSDVITGKDFYRAQHRIIFDAMYSLASENEPLDVITLSEWMQAKGVLDKAGGPGYLAELAENTPGASNVGAYAKIVSERSTLRQLIAAANRIAESALDPQGRDSKELLETAEQQVFRIHEGHIRDSGPENVKPLLERAVKRLERLFASGDTLTGLATGFEDLDKKTSGMQKSDLIIVAGRPSMGKTSFAMNLAEHALMDDKAEGAVLVFSMEMPADQLVMRMLSSLGRIDQTKMRNGKMEPEDWDRFAGAVAQLKDRNLYIDDSPALSPNDLKTRARRVHREAGGLRMIVVDYLQLMRGSGKSDNRTGEISEISRSLKALAKEMDCPVVALSQLNRSLENRPDKRPMMSDLRESGAIEQDADVILFVYRDEVYNPETEDKGLAELIIGKQRNGPIGMVKLTFIGHLTKFESHIPDHFDGYMMS
ncbi:MAG: replicative DNA helicase [Pseudomonadales bacterium]|nr:replicative DNA helicase [Pseudomonadales bacterium]